MATPTGLSDTPVTPGEGGPDTNYLVIALAAGIPCGIIILLLASVIVFMVCLTLRGSSVDQDQVEATYMQRRFQGLSLAEQRQMEQQRKKKRRFSRRRSSAAESKASSTKISPNARRAKVRRVNPFGLQDWQLRMSGIEMMDPETEETDIDGEEEGERRTVGAFNPLMMREDTDYQPNYEVAAKQQISNKRAPAQQKPAPATQTHTSSESDSDSSDSFNPYDD